jgi:hypothetical protein
MKRLLLVFGVLGAGLISPAADARECFATPAEAYAAHPNAAHVSYTRINRPQRCWYADAFKVQARETPQHLAAIAAPRSAVAPAQPPAVPRQPHARSGPAPDWHGDTAVPAAMLVPFPSGLPPSPLPAVDPRPSGRLLPIDDTPADFESRFAASGYRTRR